MVIGFCPSLHCHLSIKLFAGQGTGRTVGQKDTQTDGQTDKATICCPLWEHNNSYCNRAVEVCALYICGNSLKFVALMDEHMM